MDYLNLADLSIIAAGALGVSPEVALKVMNVNMAESALNAPAASFGEIEFYPDFVTKIGVLGYRLTKNHALPDGNKRTAFLAMVEFAERNGGEWLPLDVDDVVGAMLAVASSAISEEKFVEWVRDHMR